MFMMPRFIGDHPRFIGDHEENHKSSRTVVKCKQNRKKNAQTKSVFDTMRLGDTLKKRFKD
jgi:hypothetical protein